MISIRTFVILPSNESLRFKILEKTQIIDKINSFFGYDCISHITLKIIQDKVKHNNKVFPKIKNLSEIEKKMSKVNNEELKNSLNNFLKAFNERNK